MMALCKYIRRQGLRQFSVGCQHLCNQPDLYKSYKHLEKPKKDSKKFITKWEEELLERPWNEKWEVMKYTRSFMKQTKENEFIEYRDHLLMKLQKLRQVLLYKGELTQHFKNRFLQQELLKQSFLQERVDVLGPDIGVAHFILNRGGKIKFWGSKDWITRENMKQKVPFKYLPGFYIVAIDATGTGLYYEGVDCLRYLNKLKWLRLKGLTNLNDFSLDIISGRYGPQLEYLDLSECKGITHFGLSCFYRFKCLKGLNVTGLDHTPEFHLTCLMIQDLLPDLNIIGVDFSQYLKDSDEEVNDKSIDKKYE